MPQTSASDSASQRRVMVDGQIRTFGITNLDLIARFLAVPRENFVDAAQLTLAFSDVPLVLAGTSPRALLTPMVLAKMIQSASLSPGEKVLDVAGGLGYGAAILSGLAAEVVALESDAARSSATSANCAALGLINVTAITGDLAKGAPALAPFDFILLNGAVETGLAALLAQLADKGRLIAIRNHPGGSGGQVIRFERHGATIGERVLFETAAAVLEGFVAAPAFAF